MKEIRIHGRGGQGAVLAAELTVLAAFEDRLYGQAFPAFGGERRGAPVQAFIRLDAHPIRLRYRVNNPDWIIVLDPTLLDIADVMQGLKGDGLVIINHDQHPSSLQWSQEANICCIPATRIAQEVLGQPLVNTTMLGAFCAATGVISMAALHKSFLGRFKGETGEKNFRAAQAAFAWFNEMKVSPVRVKKSRSVSHVHPAADFPSQDADSGSPSQSLGSPSQSLGSPSQSLGKPGQTLHFAAVTAPRSSLTYRTGTWRYNRPVFDPEKCTGCGFCEMYCPDTCIIVENKKYYADYEYCKGCGICAFECPEEAIQMIAEAG